MPTCPPHAANRTNYNSIQSNSNNVGNQSRPWDYLHKSNNSRPPRDLAKGKGPAVEDPRSSTMKVKNRADSLIKLEEAVKKARGVALPEETDYTSYLFLESRTDIDQDSEEESTPNTSFEIDSSSAYLELESSEEESPPTSQDNSGEGAVTKILPSISNNHQEQKINSSEDVFYESSEDIDQESNIEDSL
uniref:Uncharacterized protein n=1 Tax=Cannabis sativa TaxID=3483 RepID=A0A803QJ10_CANSA